MTGLTRDAVLQLLRPLSNLYPRSDAPSMPRLETIAAEVVALAAEPAPVASRERVAEVLHEHDTGDQWNDEGCSDDFGGQFTSCRDRYLARANALLAAGVFRDEATVKAEALEEAALGWAGADEGDVVSAFLDARATALRAGEPS